MGKQKYTAKEKKVSRMTRNGLVEENLATKETRKVTNSDQELPYKQKDVEQAFITSEKKKNSHKKAEKKQFSEKVQEGNPAKKEEAANSPPGKRKTQGRYRYRDKPAGVSVDSAVEIRERKEKHRSQYQRQKKKQQRLQFGKLETDGSLKKEKKTSAETDGGHFQAEKNDVSTNRKKGKQKYSRKTIKTYQEVDKAARKQEAERQNKIPKDSVYTKKTNEEQKAKVKYHLYFDKKTGKTDGKKKTLSSVPKKALKNAVYQKAGEDEEENSAVDAAHKLVRSGEWILQEHSSRNIRKNRSQIHKENRLEQRAWKSASRYQYQKYLEEHPEMQKKLIRKLIQKQRIKREYQMAYRAGKIAKETKDTSIRSVNLATKIARKAQEVFVRNVTTLISMGLLLILLLSVMTGFASCSAMFSNGISTVISSSYIADPDEIEKAELYYTQLEASLQQKINQMEARYPGKDEYRYNIGEIGHDPHTLISYLTARYGDFKFDEIKGELETIFSLQYGITVEEKSETRQETSTIQVGQSLGNVVTSGYCNCPICCGVWSGGPTASGAMPQANHTLAVDAANPFLPMGTKVVMNGIEYTVEDTGNFAQYGVQFDVYYDNHAVAEAHGHQTWECFLAEGNQNSVEVTRTVTADVLNVSVQAKPLRSVILSRMEEDEQEIYEEVYSNRGNLQTYKTPVELNWYGILIVQGVDAESGIAALYVNGNEFTELTNNTLNVRLQKADTSYEYFTLQAKDKAGNMSEIYKVGNPYYENPDAVKENTEVSGTEQNAASLPADGTASKPTSATATVTEHQTTNETATAPTEPENTGNETDTEADTGRVQGESSASGMTTGTVQDKGGKEFYTIKTKSDKVFYLIVDKDKTDENVYLLTEVGENDLLNFTDTNMVTLPQNQAIAESALPLETEKITETPEPEVTIIPEEKEEPEKKSNNSGTILLMLLVLTGVCGAYYYWKFMKGRNTSFDYEEDEDDDEEEDTIREDDEELEEYEMEGEVEDEESEE